MTKRTIAMVGAGVLAGAALVGIPSLIQAGQATPAPAPTASDAASDMEQIMSDDEFRQQMISFMSEMMSDPELKEQMSSMMSDSMSGMSMDSDGMDMEDMEGMEDPGESGSPEPGN